MHQYEVESSSSFECLYREAKKFKHLSQSEYLPLIQEAQTGSLDARNEIILHLLLLALWMSRRTPSIYVSAEECLDICVDALTESIMRYDPELEMKFTTFACFCMRSRLSQRYKKEKRHASWAHFVPSPSTPIAPDTWTDERSRLRREAENVVTMAKLIRKSSPRPSSYAVFIHRYDLNGEFKKKTLSAVGVALDMHISAVFRALGAAWRTLRKNNITPNKEDGFLALLDFILYLEAITETTVDLDLEAA